MSANLLHDRRNLVHFDIFDNKLTAQNEFIILVKHILKFVCITLIPRNDCRIRTNHLPLRNRNRAVNQCADFQAIRATADKHCEMILLQIADDLQHRLIIRLSARHTDITFRQLIHESSDIYFKFI